MIGQRVRVRADVDQHGGAEGTVAGFAGLICQGAVYVALPGLTFSLEGRPLPGLPFDPHELELIG